MEAVNCPDPIGLGIKSLAETQKVSLGICESQEEHKSAGDGGSSPWSSRAPCFGLRMLPGSVCSKVGSSSASASKAGLLVPQHSNSVTHHQAALISIRK